MRVELNSVWKINKLDGVPDGEYRVLEHYVDSKSIILYVLTNERNIKRPLLLFYPDFLTGINEEKCIPSKYDAPYYQVVDEDNIPLKSKQKRDENWSLIKDLVSRKGYLLDLLASERSRELPIYAKNKKTYVQKIYRLLNAYWQFGQQLNALLPAYKLSGGVGTDRVAGETKRGAPSKEYIPGLSSFSGKNITETDKRIFKHAMKRYGFKGKKVVLTRVYNQMLKEFYADEIISAESQNRNVVLPSLSSFRYWIEKLFSADEIIRKQTTKGDYERNKRGLRGSATDHTEVIGSCFEIDATVLDVHIVSEFKRDVVLGRPTLYCVIDKESRMIVGLHVSLEYASWRAGRQALVNSFTPKKEYCARFGITINESDWPCHHVPQRLLCDRGEFICQKPEELVVPLVGHISIAPPYRADLKGIVERRFRILNANLVHELKGTTNGRHYIRGDKDPRLDAQFTLSEVTSLLIDEVLEHNSSIFKDLARQSPMFIETGLPPTPLNYWNVHFENHQHSLSKVDESQIRACLLPAEKASMTSVGIRLNDNLYYECNHPDFEAWKSIARTKGRWPIDIRIDQDNASFIYARLEATSGFTKCTLVSRSSSFEGRHRADILYFQGWLEREKKRAKPNSKSIERHNRRKEITSHASELQSQCPKPVTKNAKARNIKENRKQAIAHSRVTCDVEEPKHHHNESTQTISNSSERFDTTDKVISMLKRAKRRQDES